MNSIDIASSECKATLALIIESGIYRHHALRKRIHKVFNKTHTDQEWDELKAPHWEIIYHLIECELLNQIVSISDIPLGTGVPATTTRRLIRGLEKKNVIETNRDDRDKRRIIVGLASEYRQETGDFIADYTDGFAGLIQRHDKQERILAEAQLERTREELLDGEKRFKKLMEDLSAAVVVHAADTSISFINDKAMELLGIKNHDAMGRLAQDPNWSFFHLDKTPVEIEEYPVNQVIASGKPMQKMELGIERTTKGDVKWVLVSAVPVFKNRSLKEIIVSFMDITERKQIEEKLKREIVIKNRIFAIISHDLISPFSSLLGMTKVMSQMPERFSKEKLIEYATNMNERGNEVFELLHNLLEWSRMQMKGVEFEPQTISLRDISQKTINILKPIACGKSITLINGVAGNTVYADPDMVELIIRNLLSNSIKFTLRDGKVEISSNKKNGVVQVTVSDTGIGISKEQVDKVFALDQKNSSIGTEGEIGTGLGLPFCKEMIERNGGRIWVESTQGEGAKFHFVLPIESSET